MADLNEVRIIGRLTRDVELRSTPSGQSVATFGLATSKKYRAQTGETREETTFVDVTCWGKLADLVNQYLSKGRQVFVGGRLKFDSWEDRQSGQKRSKLSVVAENIQFLDSDRQQEPQQREPRSNNPVISDIGYNKASWNEPVPPVQKQDWMDLDPGEPPF